MKLTLTTSAPSAAIGSTVGGENKEQRESRMAMFFADPTNAHLVPVGKLLALASGQGTKTLADLLMAGETLELDTVRIGNRDMPLAPGYTISLDTVASTWGCPACKSAHGTGVGPSPSKSKKGLEANKWFYNPLTLALYTFSASCWDDYVKGKGNATTARFRELDAVKATPQGTAPVKATPQGTALKGGTK